MGKSWDIAADEPICSIVECSRCGARYALTGDDRIQSYVMFLLERGGAPGAQWTLDGGVVCPQCGAQLERVIPAAAQVPNGWLDVSRTWTLTARSN